MLIQLGGQWAEGENARRLAESNPIEYRQGEISALRDGEVLHLVAHAGGDKFGKFDAPGLFKWLRSAGLTPLVGGIQLHGCESSSFAASLATLVNTWAPGWNVTKHIRVLGIPGYHFVSSSGASWSVGDKVGDEKLWEEIKPGVTKDPSDANIVKLADEKKDLGTLIAIENLRTDASVLQDLRDTVRSQLEQDVRAVTLHDQGVIGIERQELKDLARRIDGFVQLTGAVVPSDDAGGPGSAAARTAVVAALEVLNGLLESLESTHLKPHLDNVDLEQLSDVRDKLRDIETKMPGSIVYSSGQWLLDASVQLDDLRDTVTRASESSREAKEWTKTWAKNFEAASYLLAEGELQHLKDPLLATLSGMRYPATEQQSEKDVVRHSDIENVNWSAMMAGFDTEEASSPRPEVRPVSSQLPVFDAADLPPMDFGPLPDIPPPQRLGDVDDPVLADLRRQQAELAELLK
jgi:hypothetical protein